MTVNLDRWLSGFPTRYTPDRVPWPWAHRDVSQGFFKTAKLPLISFYTSSQASSLACASSMPDRFRDENN